MSFYEHELLTWMTQGVERQEIYLEDRGLGESLTLNNPQT